jgi:hypothetical protein
MAYIGREGKLGLDVDADGHVGGKGFERDLVRDWDLDVDALQNHTRNSGSPRKPLELVHNKAQGELSTGRSICSRCSFFDMPLAIMDTR